MSNLLFDERRPQTSKMIQELLQERQQVWGLYCELGSMKPFSPTQRIDRKVQQFCQLLIDYISLGHFGVYRRIMDGSERRQRALDTAEKVYAAIEAATDVALAFNDKYEKLEIAELRLELEEDLSKLGEALATRFDLEDQLMVSLLA